MIRNEIKNILKKVTGRVAKIEYPINSEHGDYSTNVAIVAKLEPEDIIAKIISSTSGVELFEKIEAKNGFINFFIAKDYLQKQVEEVLKQKNKFGNLDFGKGIKTQVEFISANPTGPLTLGNGRGGFSGDVLANVLSKVGYEVEREYYVNDRGGQIKQLGHSVIGDEQAVYKGDYIKELRTKLKPKQGDDPEKVGVKAAKEILDKMIKPTTKKMGIKYDKWFSESKLYDKKEVEKVLGYLKKEDLAYEKEGALWFKSTKYGDEKDRVLVKTDGEKTYLAPDVAYLKNKKDRGFDKIIYFWGADHHGYVARLKAAAQALGYDKKDVEIILMQLVKLFRDGKEVKMSKRAGVYITLDELLDEVGADVARFFFLMHSANRHMNFDMDLAKEQSDKNPVYYVQYAHARICSILNNAKLKMPNVKSISNAKCQKLEHKSELGLIKQLIKLPEILEDTAKDYQLQRLSKYVTDLASIFHRFYTECRVIDEKNKELTQARLALVEATKIVLKNILDIMGISAPEKM